MAEGGLIVDRQTGADTGEADAGVAATCLKISVMRDGRPVVQVSFPAYAIVNLPDLVPEEVKPRIAAQALDLEQIAATVAARGCPQGELFSLPGPENIVRAWME